MTSTINQIIKKYNVNQETAIDLYERRNKRICECCNIHVPKIKKGSIQEKYGAWVTSYHIEHDHDTGHVRGIVCASCNFHISIIENNKNADNLQQCHWNWLEYKVSRYPYQPNSFSSVLFVK